MTPLPLQPPTDNLYKFLAITGIIGLILSFYYPLSLITTKNDQEYKLIESLKCLDADQAFEGEKIALLMNITTNSIADQLGTYTDSKNKLTLHYSDDEIKKIKDEVLDLHHSNAISIAKEEVQKDQVDQLKLEIKIAKIAELVLNMFFSFITIIGFYLWYHRIQKFTDIEIRRGRKRHKPESGS